jgi:hypothetical protein
LGCAATFSIGISTIDHADYCSRCGFVSSGFLLFADAGSEVFFLDGTSAQGYAMLTESALKPCVSFRLSVEDEPDIWGEDEISRVEFYGFEITKIYGYIKPGKHAFKNWRKSITEGGVTLYGIQRTVVPQMPAAVPAVSTGAPGVSADVPMMRTANDSDQEAIDYYVKRKSEPVVFAIGTVFKNWVKCTMEYFADCPWPLKNLTPTHLRSRN